MKRFIWLKVYMCYNTVLRNNNHLHPPHVSKQHFSFPWDCHLHRLV